VKPGESFITPEAYLTAVAGSLDDACHALLDGQRAVVPSLPSSEQSLPICFNEWCTSWGSPNHENIIAIARRLQGTGVRYIVIDDGWAQRPADISMQSNGDWIVDETKFPGGLKPTCDTLREMGFIPGIWFEFEIANPAAAAWAQDKHFVQRDGRPLRVGSRRFWDLNDPWAIDYLTTKVIDQLRDSGIGYLKVDYNDNLGLGCDHPDSLGEGLRRHIDGVHAFFRRIRSELPDLVIENCSSGGHRLEPSMQALTSMGSFSDAHEGVIIPIIARNLHRMILPRQSLIWAVLHRTDSAARLYYSLSSTFLGRVCLSGDIHDLDNEQMDIVRSALDLYPRLAEIIDHGTSSFFGDESLSYADPVGWQAVVRVHRDQALVVVHGFDLPDSSTQELNLPWRAEILAAFHDEATSGAANSDILLVHLPAGFHGGVWLMQRANSNSGSKTRNSTF
jgi:alpha-galactosidase